MPPPPKKPAPPARPPAAPARPAAPPKREAFIGHDAPTMMGEEGSFEELEEKYGGATDTSPALDRDQAAETGDEDADDEALAAGDADGDAGQDGASDADAGDDDASDGDEDDSFPEEQADEAPERGPGQSVDRDGAE